MLADDASSDNNRCDEAQEARARATKAQGESESGRGGPMVRAPRYGHPARVMASLGIRARVTRWTSPLWRSTLAVHSGSPSCPTLHALLASFHTLVTHQDLESLKF